MAKKSVWETNFAENPKILDRVKEQLVPQIDRVRRERVTLEEEWLEYARMWNVEKDANNMYNGRARLYIPEVRKNVEAQARALTEAAFPNDDFLTCLPGRLGTNRGSDIQLEVRRFQIDQAQLRVKYHVYARQAALFGTSPVFVPWRKDIRKIFMNTLDGKKIKPRRSDVEIFNGPDFQVVDLLNWYVLNPLSPNFQEFGCFYDSLIDRFELLRRKKLGEIFGYDELKESAADALGRTELERFVEKFESSGIILERGGSAGEAEMKPLKDPYDRMLSTKVYTMMELPEACLEDEDKDMPIPVVVDVYNGCHVGNIKRNPYFHQSAPFVCGKYILPQAQEFYGQGIPKAIRYMQHEINSKAEQGMDSATLALNPLAFIDPALAGNMGDFMVEPGAVWWVSPQGVKLSQMPDTTQVAYAAIANLRAQMQDYSDRSPALPPQLLGKSRTATQSEIVSSALSVDLKAFQLQNEIMVLQPLMEMWESLTDQNIDDKHILYINGGKNFAKAKQILIRKNQLLGKYSYQWRASSITQNKTMLSRQLIDLIKVYGTLPPQVQSTVKFRLDELFKILVRDGMNIPDVERLFGLPNDDFTEPDTELEMVKEGIEIDVSPGDDDQKHLVAHDKQLADPSLDEDQKGILLAHMAEHKAQLQAKAEAMRQAQMAQMALLAQQQQVGGAANSGNRTQLSPNASTGDMGSGVRA